MPREKYDKSSKWLLRNHGQGILFLGGARGVRRCRALQAEIVLPSKLPDGLLEVFFQGRAKPDYVLVEIATYPESRLLGQVLDDLTLAYQQLRVLPELLTVVLHPKGRLRIAGSHALQSRLQWSELTCKWKVVELWTLAAADLFAANDVGVIPWVPLTEHQGPPEPLLEQCRQRIEEQARPDQQTNLLAVSQVLAGLRYPDPELLAILGGKRVMIESPVIKKIVAETTQQAMVRFLQGRFGTVPPDLIRRLHRIRSEKRLGDLVDLAARCPDLEAFRTELFS